MTDERGESRTEERAPDPKPEVGERVGRVLGKAFLKVKKSRVWQDTKRSYQQGIEGKK